MSDRAADPKAVRAELENRIGKFGQVLMPEDADAPILSKNTRAAVFSWLQEMSPAFAPHFKKMGITSRKKAMLTGPPGCGKTTLAHHVAARLGMPLVVIDAHAITSMWVGATGMQIGECFAALRRYQDQCVCLFDEFDSLGASRMEQQSSAAREKNQNTNALLIEIERYKGVLIAATNLKDSIDKAIWRRFDLQLEIGLPDQAARYAILKRYLMPMAFDEPAMDLLTDATNGCTPALLRTLMESVKRHHVVSTMITKRPADAVETAESVFASLLAAIEPPPSDKFATPPIFLPNGHEILSGMQWPPTMEDQKK